MVENAMRIGAVGIANEPFIGMYSGDLRRQMDAVGLGFSRELELINTASRKGLLTLGYVFNAEEAVQDAEGLQIMRTLGDNMAWLLHCIEAGRKAGITPPAVEPWQPTNFIR